MDKYASIFAEAFIAKCFKAGLSEKAASDLLQSQIVVATDAECPGFAQGYTKVAAQFPGLLIPLPTPAMFEKRGAGKGKIITGALGLLGLGGAAALGGKKVYDRFDPNRMADGLPSLAKYTPELAKAEQQVTNAYQDPLYDLNARQADESRKLRQLDTAVGKRAPGADAAFVEAQRLRSNSNSATNKREAYLDHLDTSTDTNSQALRNMEARSQARDRRSRAWYTAPYRLWQNKVNNRDPYNESKIRDLRAQSEITSRLERDKELRLTLMNNDSARLPERAEAKPRSTFEIEE